MSQTPTKKYAKCQCGEEMTPGSSCAIQDIHLVGKTENTSKGYIRRLTYNGSLGPTCPDCNAGVGKYHHMGCDQESCPKCGLQMLGCDCWDSSMVDATILDG